MNNENNTLITIIVPIYNKADLDLKRCLDSISNQSYHNLEILLVDDGSTNNNAYMCDIYSQNDNRFRVFHQINKGVSSARNVGLDKAQGEYIMFLDADDWLELNCVELAYRYIQKKYDLIYFNYCKNYDKREEKVLVGNGENIIYKMPIIGSSCMKLYHKKTIGRERFNTNLTNGEDVEFNFRVFKNIKSYYYLNETLYHYKIQSNSAVRGYNKLMIEKYQKTLDCIKNDIDESNILEMKAFYSFCAISFIMICTNFYFHLKSTEKYRNKKKDIKKLLKSSPYCEMLSNINMIDLPISRKIVIIFAKYKLYFGIRMISFIKNKMV